MIFITCILLSTLVYVIYSVYLLNLYKFKTKINMYNKLNRISYSYLLNVFKYNNNIIYIVLSINLYL